MKPLIPSILFDDYYKWTMFQLVFNQFPLARARYKIHDRQPGRGYPKGMQEKMREQVQMMAELRMTSQEHRWLASQRVSKPTCAEYMLGYRYNPAEVELYYDNPVARTGYNEVGTIEGPWFRTIWWEVKMLLLTSAVSNDGMTKLPDWKDRIAEKGRTMHQAGMNWIDFGTRRAFDMETQAAVVEDHKQYYTNDPACNGFRGTSNMWLAMFNDITCNGTVAHEVYQAMQAKYGFLMSNPMASKHWIREYGGDLGIYLPDTLTTDVFLRSFDRMNAKLWDGPRLDSGNLLGNALKCVAKYRSYGINPCDKIYVPSDSLSAEKAIAFRDGLVAAIGKSARVTAGIGTQFVNDCGYDPRSVVCKLDAIDFGEGDGWIDVIKLSDSNGKNCGNPARVQQAKLELGLFAPEPEMGQGETPLAVFQRLAANQHVNP